MELIAEYYVGLRNYEKNDEYSDNHQWVYTSPDYDGWVVIERKGDDTIQARLTDDAGVVLSWDDYAVKNADIQLVNAVRLSISGRSKISFTSKEVAVIDRYGDYDRRVTIGKLDILHDRFKDEATRQAVDSVMEKMERISDQSYAEMYEVGQKRREIALKRSMANRMKAAHAKAEKYNSERFCHKSKQGKGRAL